MTVGCSAVDEITGNDGIITAGHTSASVGASVYYNDRKIGTLKKKSLGGNVDPSFIELTSTYKPCYEFMMLILIMVTLPMD